MAINNLYYKIWQKVIVTSDRKRTQIILFLSFITYFPFIFLGYGTDSDTFRIINTGKRLVTEQIYVPTRPPGYFLYSLVAGILDQLGGSLLTNFGSLLMGISTIYIFIRICDILDVPHKHLMAVALMIHPVFLVNATSTMDYLWALFFLLFGYYKLLLKKPLIAGVLFGVAVGFRATSAFFVIALFVSTFVFDTTKTRAYLFSMVSGGIIGFLWYIPVLVYADFNIFYLHPSIEPGTPASNSWSLFGRLGRFGYKQLYFWGIPTVILGMVYIRSLWTGIKNNFKNNRQAIIQSAFIIFSTEIIYLSAPLEPAYLLPMLPFALIIIGISFERRKLLYIISFIFIYNILSIDFVCFQTFEAPLKNMNIRIYVDPGYTLYDFTLRLDDKTRNKLNYFGVCGEPLYRWISNVLQ